MCLCLRRISFSLGSSLLLAFLIVLVHACVASENQAYVTQVHKSQIITIDPEACVILTSVVIILGLKQGTAVRYIWKTFYQLWRPNVIIPKVNLRQLTSELTDRL